MTTPRDAAVAAVDAYATDAATQAAALQHATDQLTIDALNSTIADDTVQLADLRAQLAAAQMPSVTGFASAWNVGAEATLRPRTRVRGDVTLTPGNPGLQDADVYGRVLIDTTATKPWTATLTNVRVRGTQLPPLTAPYAKNYESSLGLLHNPAANPMAKVVAVDCTFIPDYPDPRWDGAIGHDMDFTRCVFAHCTDSVSAQNTGAGANPPINLGFHRCFAGFAAYFKNSPGSPNKPPETHNDVLLQGFGGGGIRIDGGTTVLGFLSMPDGFVRPDGQVCDDPWGYVGDGAGYVPPNAPVGQKPQGNANSCIQCNVTSGVWDRFEIDGAYFDGGNFAINGAAGIKYTNSSIRNVQFGRAQTRWAPSGVQYPFYNVQAAGCTIDAPTVLTVDGATVKAR